MTRELRVFSTIAVQSVLEELAPRFEIANGIRLEVTWNTAPVLVKRLQGGETADVLILNRAGTTFRKLDEAQKTDLDQDKAIALMLAQPSMIKRPVLDLGARTLVGFKPDLYAAALA